MTYTSMELLHFTLRYGKGSHTVQVAVLSQRIVLQIIQRREFKGHIGDPVPGFCYGLERLSMSQYCVLMPPWP